MWWDCEERGSNQKSPPKLTRIDQEVAPKFASGTEEEASLPQVSVDAVAQLMRWTASMRPILGLDTPIQGSSLDGSRPSSG